MDCVYFDDEKIEKFVKEHQQRSPDEFNEELLNEIDRFRGGKEYSDDIAVLTCKIY
jgi:serine phosphatase RsbU (regulator of sigma subunit)